ncbi:tRNA(Arg) A34 adenosine deaminase TadA [Inquilinus ginsengisoli]|uniref:tRNA(Arg) A34 adenosine deaminase TadA n=1 Tax=Inquilinus ginsengisoli TaxID=363840 RepID=A0ABU1JND7_9PROT|nr:nucleoside deaminase [Inquilinus ginsengisoli]MDR6290132.1 tRNA(Arg) A34 adenosine deaminase TadA [Inquilinus ginsengisoli]
MTAHEPFLIQAIDLARRNVEEQGGRPFGAVLVRDGTVIATGVNQMGATGDPTAHAELQAIRAASRDLGSLRLDGCTVYASGHPCPMCLAAMTMTGIDAVYYAHSNEDGAPFGLSTAGVYAELAKPLGERAMTVRHLPVRVAGTDLYALWRHRQPG